jgi:hypothetical protein
LFIAVSINAAPTIALMAVTTSMPVTERSSRAAKTSPPTGARGMLLLIYGLVMDATRA